MIYDDLPIKHGDFLYLVAILAALRDWDCDPPNQHRPSESPTSKETSRVS
jgi:hypothetical protein